MSKLNTMTSVEKKAGDTDAATSYVGKEAAVKAVLVEGENVLVQGRIHPAIYWKAGAVLIFGLLLSFVIPVMGGFFLLVGLVMAGTATLTKHFLLLALTNKRVLSRYGVLQVDVVAIQFDRIESIEMERMLLGQILNYATVVILGTGQRTIRIPYIANASEFRRKYDDVTLKEKGST
ncbi:MAG TPA: hypothetical protein DEA55_10120 [Rhodospirillaceae bacterium]|nr:hypothetical protein [Rhodospirillaceae bacterium]